MSRLAPLCVVALLALCGCAGFRGGWASVPYLGDEPPRAEPPDSAYALGRMRELALPELSLAVQLHNRVRTYDLQVVLFVVPVWFDPRRVPAERRDARTRISLTLVGRAEGVALDPRRAVLRVDGAARHAVRATQIVHLDPAGRRVAQGGRWTEVELEPTPLGVTPPGARHSLTLWFDGPAPEPEQTIELDLGDALTTPDGERIPPIRFQRVRWSEGYT